MAHLPAIHGNSVLGGGDPSHWLKKLMAWNWHEWSVSWAPETKEGRKHIALGDVVHTFRIGKLSMLKVEVHYFEELYLTMLDVYCFTNG